MREIISKIRVIRVIRGQQQPNILPRHARIIATNAIIKCWKLILKFVVNNSGMFQLEVFY